MKKSFILLMSILTIALFFSCKKNDVAPTKKSFPGNWRGTWGSGSASPSNFIKFNFKQDGTLERLDQVGAVIATGTWTLNGMNFECQYTHPSNGQTHRIKGLYTDFDGAVIGTWGYSPSYANGGEVELNKL
ncbi:MAG: hypothetical protein WBP58_15785 [Chitinophagaceae bacterium]